MELQIFENQEFGKIRTMLDPSGKILFCGNDAAKALGYSDATNALKQHCKKDGVAFYHLTDNLGRKQQTKFITEGNLYRLILRSKLPSAERFEKWVVEIVLPAIRKQGAYIMPQILNGILDNPDSAVKLFLQLRQAEDRLAEMQPKADYFNALVDAAVLTNIRQTAKELNLPEKLFTYLLVEMKFAYRTSKKLLIPYAFMVNSGYAELKEYTNGKHGGVYMLFTPKGRLYLMKRIRQRLAIKNGCENRKGATMGKIHGCIKSNGGAAMKKITAEELRTMKDIEGLVIQGCGGDLNEWVDGINGLLTEQGILRNGSAFQNVSVFEHDGHTNLLFPMDGVNLDMGKLAMWRLATYGQLGGTWLSDYLSNQLGVNMDEKPIQKEKPDCPLIGQDGNIFNLMGIASRTLKENGLAEQATEMWDRITSCGSYGEALCIIGGYVNITSTKDTQEQSGIFEMKQSY